MQEDKFFAKYRELNEEIIGLVEDYNQVSFTALDIQVNIPHKKTTTYKLQNEIQSLKKELSYITNKKL